MTAPRKILVIAEAEIASTHLLMQIMRATRPHGIEAGFTLARDWAAKTLPGGVTPLFARCADPGMLAYAEALVEGKRPFLYYLDDDFWSLDPSTPLGAYYAHPSVRATLDYFVTHAAMVLTNTHALAGALRRRGAEVAVVPTFFGFDLIESVVPEPTEEIRIGYAGSLGHGPDLALVAPAIGPALALDERVVFEFIGATPPGLAAGDRIRFFPSMAEYAAFIAFQASRNWSIGLAPLVANASNGSKTDVKFREYAACSIAGLYAEFGPYPAVVSNGVDGMLVAGDGWREAIETLVRDPARLTAMRQAARRTAEARYAMGPAAALWAETIEGVVAGFPAAHLRPMSLTTARRKRLFAPLASVPVRLQSAYRAGGTRLVLTKAGRWLGRTISGREPG